MLFYSPKQEQEFGFSNQLRSSLNTGCDAKCNKRRMSPSDPFRVLGLAHPHIYTY